MPPFSQILLSAAFHYPISRRMEDTNKRNVEEAQIKEGEPDAKKCRETKGMTCVSERDVDIES